MADDGDDTRDERARLERIAWGAGSSEAEAARARIALGDLQRRAGRSRPPAPVISAPEVPKAAGATAEPVPGSPVTTAPAASATRPSTSAISSTSEGAAPGPDHERTAAVVDGGEPGLQSGPPATDPSARWDRVRRVLLRPRALPWLAGGAAAAVVVAFGSGLVLGTAQQPMPSTPSVTPTAGTVTLEQILDSPQEFADRLPDSFAVPVRLHTTRLVFTNRSLSGDDAATPWNVWAGVGSDRSTICLVASADQVQQTTACYPRAEALHGSVSLSASSRSGTLTVRLSGGGVRGSVSNDS
ncbi:hypothetical protein [Curtobacterium sp. 9128]|uniref:hypothetical protein n=1 Tax=Curtobacterium sp. 9128 TaxID=1793722 RepID=UPI0011A5C4BF|nr:hypothetical protein [Curtobacterium sp. 9128]